MGGHGGLNILPQKSWNVYGRKNRLKVLEAEEKERREERKRRGKRKAADNEFRRNALLKKAAGSAVEEPSHDVTHINLFEGIEHKRRHPQTEQDELQAERKRGRKEDRTSDARFDERFRLGYGLVGKEPWYIKRGPLPSQQPSTNELEKGRPQRTMIEAKDSKSRKHRKHRVVKEASLAMMQPCQKKSIEELRAERVERERVERQRASNLLSSTPRTDGGARYNSAFGHADKLRQHRRQP
ncbi:unnamed protein product [Ostreobium quekettii]|uniref:CBF1-interacting co-repressor CIR N-terminal domain-containing protein n=1 Tax=Ostreobium quekettii TaxID=121088 RepID=A0A8S1IQK7_9CHLO|nr:unnamed protein product [Ostreobium quekettii]|eukprot:evm.model.scf_1139.1 EVM.evm.TU.scf_1139.1   scf_1139:4372-7353(-)